MKSLVLVLALCLGLTGCGTTGTTSFASDPGLIKDGTTVLAYEVLKNNPKYVPSVQILVDAIDVELAGSSVITAQSIDDFVKKVGAKKGMDPAVTLIFSDIAQRAFQAYAAKYSVAAGVLITDPNAKLYVQAVRDGFASALVMLPKT